MIVPVRVLFMGQIDLFKIFFVLDVKKKKNPPKNKLHKKCKYERTTNEIPKLKGIK